jgi:hypothetical protein
VESEVGKGSHFIITLPSIATSREFMPSIIDFQTMKEAET